MGICVGILVELADTDPSFMLDQISVRQKGGVKVEKFISMMVPRGRLPIE